MPRLLKLSASHLRRKFALGVVAVGLVAFVKSPHSFAQKPDQDRGLTTARLDMRAPAENTPLPELLQAANHGDPVAMRNLGFVYEDGGETRTANRQWGMQWFLRAAVWGDVSSNSFVGERYGGFSGGKIDFTLARVWYEKAYSARDTRGTIGLAQLHCRGNGMGRSIADCGRLLNAAATFRKDSDVLDTKPMLAAAMFEIGGDYQHGIGTKRNLPAAADWYAKSAAQDRPSAAVALSKLYVEPGNFPRNLTQATAVLDGFFANIDVHKISEDDAKDAAAVYIEIGADYEKMGAVPTMKAVPVYQQATKLGNPSGQIALAVRYATADRLPRNIALARTLLTINNVSCGMLMQYNSAIETVNAVIAKTHQGDPLRLGSCQLLEPVMAAADAFPPPDVEPRYPNIIAPNTVQPLAKFPVMVSLNTAKLDAGTTIVSGNQQNGQLLITLPSGMTSILIAVNLVAPDMTSVDGVSTQTIELTKNQDSTTAVFQLQAGTATGKSSIFATLTYNGAFLGYIRRDVTVAAQTSAQPAAIQMASTPTPEPQEPAQVGIAGPRTLLTVGAPAPQQPAPKPGIHLDAEARAPDMTIQEIQDGTKLIYTVTSPLLQGFEKTVVLNAAARQAIVAKAYSDLESRGNALDQIPGKSASQQAKDFADGLGADLYDHEAPAAFKTVYQKLKKMGAPPQTIEVLTDEPSLPWELMRPMTDDGKREDFLGFTVSVVHSTASSAPKAPPPAEEDLTGIAVVVPQYSGDLALAGPQKEVDALKASFPGIENVPGNVTAVSDLARSPQNGIVHFAGHGVRVTSKGLPPDVGILLNDGSIIPSTWLGLAENSSTGHPFYFFNACDLGQSDDVLDYVDGWAPKLMQSGASGYLGALWKVSDTTATSFSAHFYQALKERLKSHQPWSVADVVTDARKQTYSEAFDPTALAYVLYAAPYLTMLDISGTLTAAP